MIISSEGLLVCERCMKIHDFGPDVGYDWETLVVVLWMFFSIFIAIQPQKATANHQRPQKADKSERKCQSFPLLGFPKAHLQTFC